MLQLNLSDDFAAKMAQHCGTYFAKNGSGILMRFYMGALCNDTRTKSMVGLMSDAEAAIFFERELYIVGSPERDAFLRFVAAYPNAKCWYYDIIGSLYGNFSAIVGYVAETEAKTLSEKVKESAFVMATGKKIITETSYPEMKNNINLQLSDIKADDETKLADFLKTESEQRKTAPAKDVPAKPKNDTEAKKEEPVPCLYCTTTAKPNVESVASGNGNTVKMFVGRGKLNIAHIHEDIQDIARMEIHYCPFCGRKI